MLSKGVSSKASEEKEKHKSMTGALVGHTGAATPEYVHAQGHTGAAHLSNSPASSFSLSDSSDSSDSPLDSTRVPGGHYSLL